MIQNINLHLNSTTQWDAKILYSELSAAVEPKLPAISCATFAGDALLPSVPDAAFQLYL